MYQGVNKIGKYDKTKNYIKAKENNRTEEYSNPRRVNTSLSQHSNSHRINNSKSKSKKKKKKPIHMKSHSNIPIYYNPHNLHKGSSTKKYSASKDKKKKIGKHGHHQSEANFSSSIMNKNNMLMIDGAIGIKAFINLQSLSPHSNKGIVIPSTSVISTDQMVQGGIKKVPNFGHKRTLSDNYSYNFNNTNHIYTSGPSTLDGRIFKLQTKSKYKKSQKTYDSRKTFVSPKIKGKF